MASDTPNTVLLESEGDRQRENDAQATGSVTPGYLIERTGIDTDGAKDTFQVQAHSTDDERTAALVALEYAKTGKGIDSDIAAGDHVEYWKAQPGDRLYMFVEGGTNLATSGNADVTPGDALGSAGTGALRAGVSGGNEQFEALETVNNAGSGDAARVEVEVI